MLSALHRMVFWILWPNKTNLISQPVFPFVQLRDHHCNEATRLDVPNKNARHVKFGGQVPPTVIGQSQAAMAAWHDFLGQSSRIYRASTGVQGSRIWSLYCRGWAGSQSYPPKRHPFSGTSQWAVDLGRPSSPTFACDYHHIRPTAKARTDQTGHFLNLGSDQYSYT